MLPASSSPAPERTSAAISDSLVTLFAVTVMPLRRGCGVTMAVAMGAAVMRAAWRAVARVSGDSATLAAIRIRHVTSPRHHKAEPIPVPRSTGSAKAGRTGVAANDRRNAAVPPPNPTF